MASIRLSELAARVPESARFGTDAEITSIAYDSRSANPGALFVALKGAKVDGHDFIPEAMAKGASALMVNADRAGWYRDSGVPVLVVADTRDALASVSSQLYGQPSLDLFLVGVTGTNGKTTTTHMIDTIFRTIGDRTGMIGTLGASINGKPVPQARTTPESPDLQRLFAQMRDAGVRRVAMEVSSEGALAERTTQCAFDVGVFTNLTQDHLNTHGTMDAYFAQKLRLFTEYPDAFPDKAFTAVVNGDDEYGRKVIDAVTVAKRPVLCYSLNDPGAPLYAEVVEARAERVDITIYYQPAVGSRVAMPVSLATGGLFNVYNALAAAGTAIVARIPTVAIVNGLEAFNGVPGRFETVDTGDRGFSIVVDYAHSPDGIRNVLESARALSPTRLICVFGCGGDRDPKKRPIMGGIAADLADLVVVTSDNPRSEDPDTIVDAILTGIEGGKENEKVTVEVDRHEAIRKTLCETAQPGDLVVIAGKGHETGQIFKDRTIPFDDREVAREVLASCR